MAFVGEPPTKSPTTWLPLGRAVASVFTADVFVGYDTRESYHSGSRVLAVFGRRRARVNLVTSRRRCRGHRPTARGVGVVVSASQIVTTTTSEGPRTRGGKLDYATNWRRRSAERRRSGSDDSFEEFEIDESAEHDYAHHLRSLVRRTSRHSTSCSTGATARPVTSRTNLRVDRRAVTTIHDQPNGRNINENCGSTHIEDLVAHVLELHADLGLASTVTRSPHRGRRRRTRSRRRRPHDLFALDFFERNALGGGLVVTSMSNLGLHRSMADAGIAIVETDVGTQRPDRTRREGVALRGEQSVT